MYSDEKSLSNLRSQASERERAGADILLTGAGVVPFAQVVSEFFLAFDRVEFVLKLFLCSFSVLIMLNELEWGGMRQPAALELDNKRCE